MQYYFRKPIEISEYEGHKIASFIKKNRPSNIDWDTVDSFGQEWSKFNYFDEEEIESIGKEYFDIVGNEMLKGKYVLDVGCGSGRWTKYVCQKAAFVEAIDPSSAVFAAAKLLKEQKNVRITQAEAEAIPFKDETFDFVFSLGVLHHIPDTAKALENCVHKVKKGGYFLVYLYYALDNRGFLYKTLFYISNLIRRIVTILPSVIKKVVCDILAIIIYMPFILLLRLVKAIFPGKAWYKSIPLAYYVDKSFNVIRNDALDRFGTPLEQRFTKEEIEAMMKKAGLDNIVFSENAPYWHAIGQKI